LKVDHGIWLTAPGVLRFGNLAQNPGNSKVSFDRPKVVVHRDILSGHGEESILRRYSSPGSRPAFCFVGCHGCSRQFAEDEKWNFRQCNRWKGSIDNLKRNAD
jgi:hypothetical protein